MEILSIIAMAAVAAVAMWRAVSTGRSLDASREKMNALAIEAATSRQAMESLSKQIETERAENRRIIGELNEALDVAGENISMLREENSSLTTTITHLEEERESSRQKQQEMEQAMEARFRNIASDILRQNSADLKASHEEQLQQILSPLRTNLDDFRRTVTDSYSAEARERFSLTEKIRELVELNNTISREARELTHALRGNNKVQGDWGEMVLEGILRRSGLNEGEEYVVQATVDDEGNALKNDSGQQLRPDVLVKYPDGRCVVIDSKVSLTAFTEYINSDDEHNRQDACARHVRSVRAHVDELARKKYQDFIGRHRLDFVMMFIPNEPAYIAAMRHDAALWEDAYSRHVLIVSPTHLVSGLRLIEQLWSRDKVTRNAIKIAEEAGKMYDKFADFTRDLEKISSALGTAEKAHADAMNKLRTGTGNLIKRAMDLKALGIKATKQLVAALESEGNDPEQISAADTSGK